MFMRRKSWLNICILSVVLLSGCSYNMDFSRYEKEQVNEDVHNKKSDSAQSSEKLPLNAKKAPETIKQIVTYPPGKFSGLDYQENYDVIMGDLLRLPQLGNNETEETLDAYYNVLYSLFAEEYRSPADILDNWGDLSFGAPDLEGMPYKDFFNVEIILDASGSMGAKMGTKTKMDVAKEVISEFLDKLPRGANVGLRVYGHKGSGSNSHKDLSCKSTELAYQMGEFNKDHFAKALTQFKPAGWTPIALALEAAQQDMKNYVSDKNTNIIFLVSDGVETCGGDPVASAKKIADSNIEPMIHVIGFDVDSKGQKQLMEVAKAARGTYREAKSKEELELEMAKTKEMAAKWEEWKNNAADKANVTHSNRLMEVLHISNDWSYSNADQTSNMEKAIEELKAQGHISEKAFAYLSGRTGKHFNNVNGMLEDFNWRLMRLNDHKYRRMLNEINAKFYDNTKDVIDEDSEENDEGNQWWQ